ncbi:MAG: DNA/RNA nuclease SfsA [Verrucomicrobia bacterium]|nr:DNA/RNA nuclease SfsA [Verrucomicrobiota bacterium]
MLFDPPLIFGTLIRRYKRFLADVELTDGSIVTVLCPNTGSMKSCATPGWRVALSVSDNAKRKYAHTWEMIHNGVCWIGINTGLPNQLVAEGIDSGVITELAGVAEIKREQKYGQNSRIDLLLRTADRWCYVEVKNVTLRTDDGCVAFPDAVTARGLKHLQALSAMVAQGHRAVMLYLVQRTDGQAFRLAVEIDPAYAEGFAAARQCGVEACVYVADVSPEAIEVTHALSMR